MLSLGQMSAKLARGVPPGVALLASLALVLAAAPAAGGRPDNDGFPDTGATRFLDRGGGAPDRIWGKTDCLPDRVTDERRSGPHAAAGDHFRKLRVLDGDDVFGERCELGLNNHVEGPTAIYRDGTHLVTEISFRLGKDFPVQRDRWQVVMQMKQTQPSDSGSGVPMLALNVYDGRWRLVDDDGELWSAPVETEHWTHFAFDVTYSDSASDGRLRVAVDLNRDGDARDKHERSPMLALATLKTEGPGFDGDGIPEGSAIPSHLRAGIYHDTSYRCEGYRCSIGIDDVGVFEAK